MQWTSVISRCEDSADALAEVVDQVWRRLDGAPDFVAVFASRHHASSATSIPSALGRAFADATVVGCSSWSVVGDGQEEEREPAITVTAACLADARLRVSIVDEASDPRWLDELGAAEVAALMVLTDDFTTDTDAILAKLDERFPDATKFGGLVSGGLAVGAAKLFAAGRALQHGAVVVSFAGDIEVDTIVAQGCRPIGEPMVVTGHRENVILQLNEGLPQVVLEQLYAQLPPEDQRLIPAALHLGIEVRDGAGVAQSGAYLVRPIIGIDPNSGALSTNEQISDRDVVQFHLRDSSASSHDLRTRLGELTTDRRPPPSGVLLFTCIDRGEGLFGKPNHDTAMLLETVGEVPVGGFFCGGEIGMVGGRTFVHAYTSTFAMFRPKARR